MKRRERQTGDRQTSEPFRLATVRPRDVGVRCGAIVEGKQLGLSHVDSTNSTYIHHFRKETVRRFLTLPKTPQTASTCGTRIQLQNCMRRLAATSIEFISNSPLPHYLNQPLIHDNLIAIATKNPHPRPIR